MTQISKNPYTARVDRAHPTAFIFLIDQSGSMQESLHLNGNQEPLQNLVAKAINMFLDEILNRCTKPDEVRHYFDIALIGYGENSQNANFISFGENTKEGWLSPEEITKFARYRTEEMKQNVRGETKIKKVEKPYWLEPLARCQTPMYNAFQKAKNLLESWCQSRQGQDCYPPVVINITDGVQTDAENHEMIEISKEIMQLGTMDGNVLIFNIHLSSDGNAGIAFPSSQNEVGDEHSQMLYEMSSELPKLYHKDIEQKFNKNPTGTYKAMGYNQGVNFVDMLNIGTITNMAEDYE